MLAFVKTMFHGVKAWWDNAVGTLFSPLVQNIKAHYGEYLVDIVKVAVMAAEAMTGPAGAALAGSAKMEYVVKTVGNQLLQNGMPVIENLIRGAAEAAVAALPQPEVKK